MFPHFLCIGAQRSGTTWLNNALSLHPDIWTPPIKELHYFNLKSTAPSIIALAREPLMRYRLSRLLQGMARQAYKGQNIQWKLHYFFSLRNDQWYQSLFQPGVGQIAGETTPEYSILAPEVVAEMYNLMPDLKIIFLMRNPMERTWSQANQRTRKIVTKGKHVDEPNLRKFMDDDHPHKRSMYCDILKIWEQVYPKEQLYIGFFEQIAENPVQLLSEIYTFLGVDNLAPDLYRSTVEQKVNMGVTEVMPIYWRRYLAQRYYDQIECLHARFGNNSTAEWLASAKQAMG